MNIYRYRNGYRAPFTTPQVTSIVLALKGIRRGEMPFLTWCGLSFLDSFTCSIKLHRQKARRQMKFPLGRRIHQIPQ